MRDATASRLVNAGPSVRPGRPRSRDILMRIDDAVAQMTKGYLDRVIDSFTRDFPKLDEDRAREIIIQNADELSDTARIERQLSFDGYKYSDRILQTYILEFLLRCPGYTADEQEIVDGVTATERAVVESAKDPDSLRYEDQHGLDVMETVLSVALEDEHLSQDEFRLIQRLRHKLRVRESSKRILLARMGSFPRPGNEIHAASEFRDALNELQRRGVVFYCNRLNGGRYVVPDEVVPGVKSALDIELAEKPWRLLLSNLSKAHLSQILESAGVPKSGSKDELIDRVVSAGIQPSEALDVLSNQALYDICSSLPGANVSGTKQEKVERIVEYFDHLVVKDVPAEAPPGERYFEYLVELARRDRENLLTNKVIKKDLHMERSFEAGLCYLFEHKLGLELETMPGSDHPDGLLAFPNGDLFMWDAKSKEEVYTFPASHLRQFKRYIRDAPRRVSCFMVIVPEVADSAAQMAARLKVESKSDTDVSLITAEELLSLAQRWAARDGSEPFNLEVFNVTGILDRKVLDQRLKLFR